MFKLAGNPTLKETRFRGGLLRVILSLKKAFDFIVIFMSYKVNIVSFPLINVQ